MRLIVKILTYLMLLVLLTAEDCGNNSPPPSSDELRLKIFENIEDQFTSEQLSEEQLAAFEIRAEQKLIEIFDLVNIYADTSLDFQFRKQALQSIKAAFISEEDVNEFLALKNRRPIKSVTPSRSLKLTSTSRYTGEISYNYTQGGEILSCEMNMILEKTAKQFGDSSLYIWRIFFKL